MTDDKTGLLREAARATGSTVLSGIVWLIVVAVTGAAALIGVVGFIVWKVAS